MNAVNPVVWVVDDDDSMRWVLQKALEREQIDCQCFSSADDALAVLSDLAPDAIVTDIRMPGTDGFEFLKRIRHKHPQTPIILMTAQADLNSAVDAFQLGAFDYIAKPFDLNDAMSLISRACRTHTAKPIPDPTTNTTGIIGQAPAMQALFRAIARLSRSNATVLLSGESGTGKELVARALHQHSLRHKHPFIALNTAAIPSELLESELFGHEKGAFTGAHQQRKGRFEQAEGGSLFLDEIGDMPLGLQTRLLRVIAEGELYRVGGQQIIATNVRIIAATHQNLEQLVAQGRFREDLYHRLNVIRLQLPPLRERREDIHSLLQHFLARAASDVGVACKSISPTALNILENHAWSGNIRQLENTCRWLTVMTTNDFILPDDLPDDIVGLTTEAQNQEWETVLQHWLEQQLSVNEQADLSLIIPKVETLLINAALNKSAGHRQRAAKLLGWGRNTLTRKIKDLDI